MGDGSKIEWTDATWNPITGCTVVSPGCTNCYAMRLAGTRLRDHPSRNGLTQPSKAGPVWTGEVRFNEAWLEQPLRWKKPRMIFVCAHGDLFYENVPDEWIDKVFAVMAQCPQHTFQVLTKRAGRMQRYISLLEVEAYARVDIPWPLPNVWLGISAEDQERYNERGPALANTPAAVRFVSYEPALGPLDLSTVYPMPDWIIVGGESGPGARFMQPDWARAVRDQCENARMAFFMKQMARKERIPPDLLIRKMPRGQR